MAIFSKANLAASEQASMPGAIKHTVMIVDDQDANLSVMAAILRPYFHLIEARDGQEALKLIEAMPAADLLACIVSDHRMPNMTGVKLFEHVTVLRPHARRILVTGFLDLDAIVDSINKGEVYRFIAKPFDATDFLLTVRCAVLAFEEQGRMAAYHAALEEQVGAECASTGQLLRRATEARLELADVGAQLRALRARDGR